ncbi:UNKNOWN [Stylonychia lemnae]|uniref:Uncharacterized protein n=1 Tax=Stylonychia lemnae TaxID=5949 RepID=A0A078A2X0_STYLE|nr:UNKNOWN [Stylonychia lemnae]|eukprot:CDW76177.1 UNKNOWN [Stylonychia lemnae]
MDTASLSPLRRPKQKDLDVRSLRFSDKQYKRLSILRSKNLGQSSRRTGSMIINEDSDELSDADLDHDELQQCFRNKLNQIKGYFDQVSDIINDNAKAQKSLTQIIKEEYISSSKLALIFKDFNDLTEKTEETDKSLSPDKKEKQSTDLNYEIVQFQQTMKTIVKDMQIFREFVPKFEYDKKNFNIRINDRVRINEFTQGLQNLENKLNRKVDDKFEDLDRQFAEVKKITTEKVTAIEDLALNLEKNIQWRIMDCEQLLKSRVNEQYETVNDSSLSLGKVVDDVNTKLDNQGITWEEKLQLFKKMFYDFEQKIKQKLDVSVFNKTKTDSQQQKINFDQQFDMMTKSYQTFEQRNKDNQIKIAQLFQYQEERDTAIKNIPPNVELVLKELDDKIKGNYDKISIIENELTRRIEVEQHQEDLDHKLDIDQFHKWFPRDMLPSDYIQQFVKRESELMQKNILDMAKMWDSKLVKLRQDMNIHSIIKKIGEKAEQVEVKDAFETQMKRIEQIEENFVQIINEVESISITQTIATQKMDEIHQRQQEVLIGKRNVNCLSCAQDPSEKQMQGKDGKIYRNVSVEEKIAQVDLESLNQSYFAQIPPQILTRKLQKSKRRFTALPMQRLNKSNQMSRQESPDSQNKLNKQMFENSQSAYQGEIAKQMMNMQNGYSEAPTRVNTYRHARSISQALQEFQPIDQRYPSYIESNSNQNGTFIYESGQEINKIKQIIKNSVISSGVKHSKLFNFNGVGENKERKRMSNAQKQFEYTINMNNLTQSSHQGNLSNLANVIQRPESAVL